MKKIGIVTLYYKNYNYGGQLQAYAMQKLFSRNGFAAELVSFENEQTSYVLQRLKDLGIRKTSSSLFNKLRFKLHMRNSEFRKKHELKMVRFNQFMDSIPHTQLYNKKSIVLCNEHFQAFVCGSDQIWNPGWWNDILFLDFSQKPKFSYAASIARKNLSKKELSYFFEKTYDYIAVSLRERQAQKLLKDKLNIDTEFSLDPTLVVDVEEWNKLAEKPNINEKYILFYMVGDSKGLKKRVYSKCKERGYQVYSIGFSKNTYSVSDIQYSDYVIKDAGPRQWLGWIANAQYVFTDSFHGSVFSILFNKQFWCFERDNLKDPLNENSRLYNFLEITGLEHRLLEQDTEINIDTSEKINFEMVDAKLCVYRELSQKYIDECLKQVETNA